MLSRIVVQSYPSFRQVRLPNRQAPNPWAGLAGLTCVRISVTETPDYFPAADSAAFTFSGVAGKLQILAPQAL